MLCVTEEFIDHPVLNAAAIIQRNVTFLVDERRREKNIGCRMLREVCLQWCSLMGDKCGWRTWGSLFHLVSFQLLLFSIDSCLITELYHYTLNATFYC